MSLATDVEGYLLRQILTAKGGSQPVIDSYNWFINSRLKKSLESSKPIELPNGDLVTFRDPAFIRPRILNDLGGIGGEKDLLPYEARTKKRTYAARLFCKLVRSRWENHPNPQNPRTSIPTLVPLEVMDVYLGEIPVLIHSELDHLYQMNAQQRQRAGESDADPGGYFIIKGAEKVLLNIEKLRTLMPLLYELKQGQYIVRYTSTTVLDSTIVIVLESSKQDASRDVHVTFTKMGSTRSINIFYIFYLLGLTVDPETGRSITIESSLDIMETFIFDDDPVRQARRRKELRQYLQKTINTFLRQTNLNHDIILERFGGKINDSNIKNTVDRNDRLIHLVREELFKNIPFVYNTAEERNSILMAKIRLLASMVAKFVDFKNGYRKPDDRDSWAIKKISDVGDHMSTHWNVIWKIIRAGVQKSVTDKRMTTLQEVRNAFNSNDLTESFNKAFTQGIWGGSRDGGQKTTIVDTLKRDTLVAVISHIRRISIPINRRTRTRRIRMIDNSSWGVACPVMTPEGESCLALDTLITMADGRLVQIKDLKDGDCIVTVDPITRKKTFTKIHDHFIKSAKEYGKKILKIVVASNRSIVCTEDHPFLTHLGWINAGDLNYITHLLIMESDDRYVPENIISIEPHEDCLVADFTTDADTHNMIANGFVTHNCGLVKDSGLVVYISLDRDDQIIRARIENQYNPAAPSPDARNSVYLNGVHLGYTASKQLYYKLVQMRRQQLIYFDTGLLLDEYGDLWIMTNSGRACRPLLIVNQDTQQLLIDEMGLRGRRLTDLMRAGVIEYMDVAEQIQPYIYIAERTQNLRDKIDRRITATERVAALEADPTTPLPELMAARVALENIQNERPYTHAEVDPTAILGISASMTPFPEFMPAPRNAYQAAMIKQALGPNSSRNELRYDTTVKMLTNPSVPLVATDMHELLGLDAYPAGDNAIVAVTTYGGGNQEDAVIFNQDSLDRGLFNLAITHSYKTIKSQQNNRQEYLRIPTHSPNQEQRYANLDRETGLVRVGSFVKAGDCLVGKIIVTKDAEGNQQISDASLYVDIDKYGFVEDVSKTINADRDELIQIRIRQNLTPQPGDKFASRYAQKGVIGEVKPGVDMPVIQSEHPFLNGVSPDIIFNPHGIPSRMTMNKLYEIHVSSYAALTGERINATGFRRFNYEEYRDALSKLGYSYSGKEKMMNGQTGRTMDVEIFVGSGYYQVLRHLVESKMRARGIGALQFLTRQPVSGIRKGGGLRVGEMERDTFIEHGAAYVLQDRLMISSDAYSSIVCQQCGTFAYSVTERAEIHCRMCRGSNFGRTTTPYSFRLLTNYLSAMGIKVKLTTRPTIQ